MEKTYIISVEASGEEHGQIIREELVNVVKFRTGNFAITRPFATCQTNLTENIKVLHDEEDFYYFVQRLYKLAFPVGSKKKMEKSLKERQGIETMNVLKKVDDKKQIAEIFHVLENEIWQLDNRGRANYAVFWPTWKMTWLIQKNIVRTTLLM